jgi:peptide/nickel transport system substrate-binding protein
MWLGGDPPSFDAHQESTYQTLHPASPCYNLLVQYDPKDHTKIIPDLAERWEVSPDGKVYTFYLKRGVKFHHGKPFKAEDVKASFERIIRPPGNVVSPRKGVFESVTGIETTDDYTVRFVLKRPSASFLANVAQGWNVVYAKDILERGDPKKDVAGTGPFKLKNYTRGVSIELERNPEYHVSGLPYLDGIRFFIVPDPNTAIAAFLSGQLDVYRTENKAEADEVAQRFANKATVKRFTIMSNYAMEMNARRKPWDDPWVRLAASLAIDRAAGVKVLTQGEGEVGGILRPDSQWALSREELAKIPGYGADKARELDQARRLLGEAGVGAGFKATMLTRKGAQFEAPAVFLKDQLAKIGIDVTLDVQESAAFYDRLNRGEFELFGGSYSAAVDDPDAVFGQSYLCDSERNYSRFCLPQLEDLFVKQSQTMDVNERKRLVWEMERLALTNVVKAVIAYRVNWWLWWNKVRNFYRQPSYYLTERHEDVWLAES